MARPYGVTPAEPPPILGGSHDPLLQWALVECRAGLAILPEGSESGYRRFLKGEVIAAAIHFHDFDDLDKDANIELIAKEPTLYDAVLVHFCSCDQGLVVATGNPLGLGAVKDLKVKKARVAVRPEGAGAQQLLLALLKRDGLTLRDLGQSLLAPTSRKRSVRITPTPVLPRAPSRPLPVSISCRSSPSASTSSCARATATGHRCKRSSTFSPSRHSRPARPNLAASMCRRRVRCDGRRNGWARIE
jgi:hypothetical protein